MVMGAVMYWRDRVAVGWATQVVGLGYHGTQ